MIRLHIIILAFLLPFISLGQDVNVYPIDPETGLITYQEVVQQNGTQDELYIKGIDWLNTHYKNPADVCKVRNRESGVIELLHRIEVFNTADGSKVLAGMVNYDLKIEFKPGRYRYTLTDLTFKQASRFPVERWLNKADPLYSPVWDSYMQQVDAKAKEIINSLKENMQPEVVKPEEKW
ncbi:MAG: DUF4468 domain-containing protein [Chloroflexota bacterium]|jgi:hypothetical protein|nr:DUF4468 domain-containing protein [Lentimicrobium sp.]